MVLMSKSQGQTRADPTTARRGRGRPKLPPETRRSAELTFRGTPSERAAWARAAEAAGAPLTIWLRDLANRAAEQADG